MRWNAAMWAHVSLHIHNISHGLIWDEVSSLQVRFFSVFGYMLLHCFLSQFLLHFKRAPAQMAYLFETQFKTRLCLFSSRNAQIMTIYTIQRDNLLYYTPTQSMPYIDDLSKCSNNDQSVIVVFITLQNQSAPSQMTINNDHIHNTER